MVFYQERSKNFTLANWLVDELLDNGYDGVIYDDDTHSTIAAFSSNQIKSAIGNVGTFSGKTGNIRFSKASTKFEVKNPEETLDKITQAVERENTNALTKIKNGI